MKDFEDAMLELSWNNYTIEYQRYKDIDNKAIGIITISGILISFLIGSTNAVGSKGLFILTTLSFLIAVFFCVLTLRVRSSEILNSNKLIEELKSQKQTRQIRGTVGTIAKVEMSLQKACESKIDDLRIAVHTLVAGVFFLIFYSISTIFPTINDLLGYLIGLCEIIF